MNLIKQDMKFFKPVTRLLEKEKLKENKIVEEEDLYEGLEDYLEDDFGNIEDIFQQGDYAQPYETAKPVKASTIDIDEETRKQIEKISPSDDIPEDFGEQVLPQQEKQIPGPSYDLQSYSEDPPEYEQGPYLKM